MTGGLEQGLEKPKWEGEILTTVDLFMAQGLMRGGYGLSPTHPPEKSTSLWVIDTFK